MSFYHRMLPHIYQSSAESDSKLGGLGRGNGSGRGWRVVPCHARCGVPLVIIRPVFNQAVAKGAGAPRSPGNISVCEGAEENYSTDPFRAKAQSSGACISPFLTLSSTFSCPYVCVAAGRRAKITQRGKLAFPQSSRSSNSAARKNLPPLWPK